MPETISTAIPAVEAAILAVLEEAPDLADVLVTGDYRRADQEREYVWLWKAKATREFKGIGRRPAKQEEEIEVTLRVLAVADTPAEAKTRAYELAGITETALRYEMRLDQTVLKNRVKQLQGEPLAEFDPKFGFHVLMTVAAETRI